jgi:hypothetical protein
MEIYKIIEGYPDYAVSTHGNVINIKTHRVLKPCKNGNGYLQVCLRLNKKKKMMLVSRLVALAFINNPENKAFVDHIDRNLSNNNVENLRWATRAENNQNRDCVENATNIYVHKKKYYHVRIMRYNNLYQKCFKTEAEAILWRDEVLATF